MGSLTVTLEQPARRWLAWARAGGPGGARRLEAANREMVEAAVRLPPLVPRPGPAYEVVYLTGADFWHQTLFCFVSLYQHAGNALTPILYDDGSLGAEHLESLRRTVPWVRVVHPDDVEARLDRLLPQASYPTLRKRRRSYVHLRKLVDVRVGSRRPQLVLDSDLLFFRRPDALLDWLEAPECGLYMEDFQNAYGYSEPLLRRLAGGPIRPRVNVGVCGLLDPDVDWDLVEAWCRELEALEGAHYFQEQALTALWLSVRRADLLPARDYRLRPDRAEVRRREAVMHHYVLESRRPYIRTVWRDVARAAVAEQTPGRAAGARGDGRF